MHQKLFQTPLLLSKFYLFVYLYGQTKLHFHSFFFFPPLLYTLLAILISFLLLLKGADSNACSIAAESSSAGNRVWVCLQCQAGRAGERMAACLGCGEVSTSLSPLQTIPASLALPEVRKMPFLIRRTVRITLSGQGQSGNKYMKDHKMLKIIKNSGIPVKFLCLQTQHQRCPCLFPVPCTGHKLGLFRAAKSTPERAPGPLSSCRSPPTLLKHWDLVARAETGKLSDSGDSIQCFSLQFSHLTLISSAKHPGV